jgi:hypothetical protein
MEQKGRCKLINENLAKSSKKVDYILQDIFIGNHLDKKNLLARELREGKNTNDEKKLFRATK